MLNEVIALIRNELEGLDISIDKVKLAEELEILKNIKESILSMELGEDVNPEDVLKENPNILFFKDSEAEYVSSALETKKLVEKIIELNLNICPDPAPMSFMQPEMFTENTEEVAVEDIVDCDCEECCCENECDTCEDRDECIAAEEDTTEDDVEEDCSSEE